MAAPSTPSPLDRFLRLFTDVRAGEGVTAALLSFDVLLLLSSYYILKSVRDGLILAGTSAEIKSYTNVLQVLVLVVIVPLYGKLADRVPRRRLINVVTMAFAISFAAFTSITLDGTVVVVVFYVWVSVFGAMIIAQFWSFANDLYAREAGERLFPLVAFGSSLGAVVGANLAGQLAVNLGIPNLILVAVAMLAAQMLIINYIDKRERRRHEAHLPLDETTAMMTATRAVQVERAQEMLLNFTGEPDSGSSRTNGDGEGESELAGDGKGAFALVLGTRYLLMIGVLTMLLNFVNTTGGYVMDSLVLETAREIASGPAGGLSQAEFMTAYYGSFYSVVNLIGLLTQLFLVSRIVKYLGVGVGLMILPIISLGAYGLITFVPVLGYVRWAKTAENATDYSLNNTVRNMLFLPTTREQKYKAKQVVDSFAQRAGDTLSALLVLIGTTMIALSTSGFAIVNIAAVLIWLVVAFKVGKEYKRLADTGETPS